MRKSAKSRAEEQFARTRVQQQDKKAQKDREKAETDRAAHIARLRALRLAKESADKEAAVANAGKTTGARTGGGRKTPEPSVPGE